MAFLFGLALFGLGVYCVSRIYDGFRTGEMQIISRNIVPMFFFRKFEPILFWSAAIFNSFLAAICLSGVAILFLQGLSRK